MTLKQKLFSIALAPFLIALIALGSIISTKYEQYKVASDTSAMASDLILLSNYITRMQLERGKITGHMNGNTVSEEEFKKIYSDTNAILQNIKAMPVPFSSAKTLVDNLVSNESKLNEVRAQKTENSQAKIDEVAKFYSSQVETVLKIYDNVRAVTIDPKIVNALTSLYELENTKETAGKLRAKLNSVFGAKKSLTDSDYQKTSYLFLYIQNKLSEKNSNYLYEKTNSNLNSINESSRFKNIQNYEKDLYLNHTSAKYSTDSKDWFKDISENINSIGNIIKDELKLGLESKTLIMSKESKSSMIFYSLFTFLACVFCTYYPLWVSRPISAFIYAMKNVAGGNLEINIRTDKKDEISEMSNQLQNTAENLEKVFMRKKFSWDEIAKMKADQELAMKEATESKDKALVALKAADEAKALAMKDKESAVAAEKNAKVAQEEAQELALKIKKDNEETNAKVKDIQNELTKVCAGDLTVTIPHNGEDAIGLISKNLNVLVQSFKSQIQELTTVVHSLSKMVHSIEETNGDVINAQENTLNKVVIVSSASEEISSSIQTVSAATEEMKASISEISKVTHESNNLVSKTSKDVEHSAMLIDKLSKSSDGISSIIQIINSIASQTNLLALNATIEASRAGDAGKGFAVVAHEIKELAHQTQNATKSIEENINAIQDDSKTVITSIASMAKSFERISEYSTHVSAAIEEQVSTSAEIGQSMMEASSGIEGVTKSMFEVKTLSETSSKSVHYSTLNLQEIAKMSKAVEALVNKYKINNEKKENLKMAA